MFKTLRSTEPQNLNHSGRSYVGETLQSLPEFRGRGVDKGTSIITADTNMNLLE